MRIAYINTVAGYNATGRLCEDLASAKGIEGKIFYGRKSYQGKVNALKFNNLLGNGIHVISTFLLDNHAYVNTMQTKRLVEELEKYNPDIIHLHNLHGYYLDVEELFDYIKKYNKKVVWTFHDCWPMTGHCAHFDGVSCNQWKTECKHCPILSNYPPTFNGKNTSFNHSRKKNTFNGVKNMVLVSPSTWLANQLKQSYLSTYPIQVINNGIDLNQFCYKKKKRSQRLELLAVASVWTKMKGLNDLVQFANLLPDSMHLTVVGLINKQISLFPKNVTCFQRTNNRDELVDLYNSSDYFLNFTYEDTFPTVNIEALACGLPIITYNTGGSAEIIDNKTGFIVDKGNYQQALSLLGKGNVFKREDCVNRSKQFNRVQMIQSYLKLYNKIMSSK